MKRIIRLTETDLTNLVRRIIKENDENEILDCVADAAGLKASDLIKLLPCRKLQEDNPSSEDIKDCMEAAADLMESKGYTFSQMIQIGIKATKCVAGGSGGSSFPGIEF